MITAVWQEHVVTEEAETGGAVESTIRLPVQASPFVTASLTAACADVARAGGPNLAREVVSRLAGAYRARIVTAYTSLLDDISARNATLPQPACVQLLFDFNFASDVLIGGEEVSSGTSSTGSGERGTSAVEAARQRLTSLVDPFDLDVFAPFLRESRARLYQRTALLLGFFAQLRPLHAGARTAPAATDRHSLLPVCNPAPRMALLPVAGGGVDSLTWFGDSPALVALVAEADKLEILQSVGIESHR